jgi:hypothetical protein
MPRRNYNSNPMRTGRPPDPLKDSDVAPPDNIAEPDGFDLTVEGTVFIAGYERSKVNDVYTMEIICAKLGLALHRKSIEKEETNKNWNPSRVPLDIALGDIADNPGILFDLWVHRNYLDPVAQKTIPMDRKNAQFKAARNRATVALYHLSGQGRVDKRRTRDGLRLYIKGKAEEPKKLHLPVYAIGDRVILPNGQEAVIISPCKTDKPQAISSQN